MRLFSLQLIRFGLVGIVNTLIGLLAIYAVLFFTAASAVQANALGYALGFSVGFVLNRAWTFNDRTPAGKLLPWYLGVAVLAYAANLAVVVYTNRQLGMDKYIVQLLGCATYTALMYWGCRYFVFNGQRRPSHGSDSDPGKTS
jgi:putative flippase GtrA